MKKLFTAAILCTALLCGCSEKDTDEISENGETVTVGETVTTTSVTQTETTTTTKATTTTAKAETTVTEEVKEEIILTPIPSDVAFEVLSCEFTVKGKIGSDEEFPDKEVLKRAREICFADEEIAEGIEMYNKNYVDPERGDTKIETAEDIEFSNGFAFDFDGDGEDEYAIVFDCAPLSPMWGCCVIFIDGDNYEIEVKDAGITNLDIVSGSGYYFVMVTIHGATFEVEDIYRFEDNKIKSVLNHTYKETHSIDYENGIFYLWYRYDHWWNPFVLCGDGVFRQLGREKISREDFESHVQNGGAYLDRLADEGDEVTEIYTYGYFRYELCGEDFGYDVFTRFYDNDKSEFSTEERYSGIPSERRFTDEVVYGDVWAAQTLD